MDERIEKEEITYSAEMAGWGDDNLKEKSTMSWITDRSKEISTWSGASLVGLGLIIVLGGPFLKLLGICAIGWGLFSMIKKQG